MNDKSLIVSIFVLLIFLVLFFCFRTRDVIVSIPSSFSAFQSNEGLLDNLLEYMIKSRYWEVRPTRKGISCRLRKEFYPELFKTKKQEFSAHLHFYISEDNLLSIKKGEWTYSNPINTIKVPLNPSFREKECKFLSDSYFELASGVELTIHEKDHLMNRTGTEMILLYFDDVLTAIENKEMNLLLEKEGSILNVSDSQDFILVENSNFGCLSGKISGWVNPGEKGYVDIAYFAIPSLEEVGKRKRFRTNEYVGWDDSKTNKYYFSSDLVVDGDGELHDFKTQVNFYSDKGDERILLTTNLNIRTWIW